MKESTYFRAKAELLAKEWITAKGDNITPIMGFPTLKNESTETQEALKNESLIEIETLKNESATLKIESQTLKNESTRNYISPAILPAILPTKAKVELEGPTPPAAVVPTINQPAKKNTGSVDDAERVFEHWRDVSGHSKAKYLDERKTLIAKWLKKFSVDELCLAIDGWALSSFHQGENPTRTVYSKLNTILKNGEQIEDFMGLADKPAAKVHSNGNFQPVPLPEMKTSKLEVSIASN